jgi:Flp pilus assembly protein TadG
MIRRNSRKGSAMLELALFFPLLVTVLLGASDFLRVFHAGQAMTSAARAGLQHGVSDDGLNSDAAGITAAAKADALDYPAVTVTSGTVCACSDGSTVSCTSGACSAGGSGRYLQVSTQITYTTLVNWYFVPQSFPVRGKAMMRLE